jgi:hypothetical protein
VTGSDGLGLEKRHFLESLDATLSFLTRRRFLLAAIHLVPNTMAFMQEANRGFICLNNLCLLISPARSIGGRHSEDE